MWRLVISVHMIHAPGCIISLPHSWKAILQPWKTDLCRLDDGVNFPSITVTVWNISKIANFTLVIFNSAGTPLDSFSVLEIPVFVVSVSFRYLFCITDVSGLELAEDDQENNETIVGGFYSKT
ncbi:hypothetical protein LIER_36505 [Lithospermum erythrorhizon]|uniref:Uncharacterized protein n=1 Tax=Lithospermum erythrorhizon TaxID=34254 RepID=A0AAV3PBJ5_LITER